MPKYHETDVQHGVMDCSSEDSRNWQVSSRTSFTDMGLVLSHKNYKTGVEWTRGYECPWPLPFPVQESLF